MSSNGSAVINLEKLSKRYQVFHSPIERLKQLISNGDNSAIQSFDALKPLTLEIHSGDVVGIIGRNGSGKSTLLQMVCGTLTPTEGRISVTGKIAALLELGAGFNPDFSGRENVYLSGALMGIDRKALDAKFDEILRFSGIEDFIDRPVKTYSSGMFVRLAFAVATSTDPDILVIDEALSVGDGAFAKRSFDRIMSMKESGKTILFCSHSLYQVETICNKVLWLDKGEAKGFGAPADIVPKYESFLESLEKANDSQDTRVEQVSSQPLLVESARPKIREVEASVPGAQKLDHLVLKSGQSDLNIDVRVYSPKGFSNPGVAVVIHNEAGTLITSCGSWEDGFSLCFDANGEATARLCFRRIPLLKGRYRLGVILFCDRGLFPYEEVDPVLYFDVVQTSAARGLVELPRSWERPVTERWRIALAEQVDSESLSRLFERCFGTPFDPELWRWKYPRTKNLSTVVFDGGQLAAFVGVGERAALVKGELVAVAQLGDVMVRPESRGVLGRKGAFYRATANFLEANVGRGKSYPFAFGFPHYRAFKVGERLSLYTPVDRVHKAIWLCSDFKPDIASQMQLLKQVPVEREVDQMWHQMAAQLTHAVIGVRDWSWYQYRYLSRPGARYEFRTLCNGDGLVLATAVVKSDGGELVLLDYLGSKDFVTDMVCMLRSEACERGLQALTCWLSSQSLAWFSVAKPLLEEMQLIVPGSAMGGEEQALSIKNCWWLMGGDTDFL